MSGTDREAQAWHTRTVEHTLTQLGTDADRGLAAAEAGARLERFGRNRIEAGDTLPWWRLVLGQFTDPLIYILLIAAGASVFFEEHIDAAVIMVVVLLNAVIGFVQEFRARKAIDALAEMSAPRAVVIRDGTRREVDGEEVVPGDIVVLTAGGRVPADGRLVRVRNLSVDESTLTGEADAVSKRVEPVADEQAVPGDQLSMVFSGTSVTRGSARAVVVRTGESSELGRIAEATRAIEHVETPIQRKVHQLGKAIGLAVVGLAVLIIGGGLLAGMNLDELVRTSVALAVGAVPEALPVVLTVTLAIGVRRMAARNAIIRSLPAVETLGSTTVIGTDKTGTLTANRMTVREVWAGGQRHDLSGSDMGGRGSDALRLTLLAGVLANEVEDLPAQERAGDSARTDTSSGARGDPTELALLAAAARAGFDLEATRAQHPAVDIIPFESERQLMATLNDSPDGRCVFLKGSPEAVLERCNRMIGPNGDEQPLDVDAVRDMAGNLADSGQRVLAMSFRRDERDRFHGDDPGSAFVLAGLQAMEDPVREEAVVAVREARGAGIRVIMLTGDHARTARAIGAQLGLGDDDARVLEGRELNDLTDDELDAIVRDTNIFARVSPDHKLRLVERLKAHGHIVAVTGDGVNDAPALQAAHLGVAMGRDGTDVARQASDMVLADDNFASITAAVEEGRVVFSNIRKVTYFLLSTGAGLVLTILSSLIGPWPLPFLAAQVLWINLVTNGLQDVALAFEKGEAGLLDGPPRDPGEGVLNRGGIIRLVWVGALIATGTVAVFTGLLARGVPLEVARSVAMTQMVMFQFFHVLNARSLRRSVFQVPLSANPFLAFSLLGAITAHIGALHLPFMQNIFETVPLTIGQWAMVTAVGSLIIVAAEVDKLLRRRRGRGRTAAQ